MTRKPATQMSLLPGFDAPHTLQEAQPDVHLKPDPRRGAGCTNSAHTVIDSLEMVLLHSLGLPGATCKNSWLLPSQRTCHLPSLGSTSRSCGLGGQVLPLDWLRVPSRCPGGLSEGRLAGGPGATWSGAVGPPAAALQWRKDGAALSSLSVFINIPNMKHFSFLPSDG